MQAKRQPGSSFKPFVYAAALEDGYTPQTKVLDGPFSINQGAGLGMWSPKNFAKNYLGPTTLRRGLELSRNVMTVRLASQIGMARVADVAERFGVYDRLPRFLANALGAYETTLLRVATGYAEFANGGKKITASLIDRVQDRNGKTIWRHDQRPCDGCNDPSWHGQSEPLLPDVRKQIIDQVVAYQIVSMMEGVVQRGTGTAVKAVGKPVAGKTGTSNDAKDVWFVGYSPDLVAGAYVGFDNPRTLGAHEQGAITAAPIFRDFMKPALADALPTPFRVPVGAILVPMPDGKAMINEVFRPGTEPGAYVAPPSATSDAEAPTGTPSDTGEGTGGLY
jgi:penicillin-binding protein 1A